MYVYLQYSAPNKCICIVWLHNYNIYSQMHEIVLYNECVVKIQSTYTNNANIDSLEKN